MDRKEQNNLNESIRKVVNQQNEEALGSAPNISPDARTTQEPGKFNTIGGIDAASPTTSGNKKSGTKSSLGTTSIPTGKVTVYGGPGKGFVEVDDDDERLSWFRQNSRSAASNLGVQLDYLRKFNPTSELIPSLTRQIDIQNAIADGSPVTPLAKDFEDERKISMTTGAVMSDDEIMQKLSGVPEYSAGRNPKVLPNLDNKPPKVKTPGQEDDNREPVLADKRSKVKEVIDSKEVKTVDEILSEYQPETIEAVKNKFETFTRDGFAGVRKNPPNTKIYGLAAAKNAVEKQVRKARGDQSLAFDALATKAKGINKIRTVVIDELARAIEDGNTDMIYVADGLAKVAARYIDVMRRLPPDLQTHQNVMISLASFKAREVVSDIHTIINQFDGDMFDPRFMQGLFARHGIAIQPETIEDFILYGKQSNIIPNRRQKRAKIAQRRAIEKRLVKEGLSKKAAHKASYQVLKEEQGPAGPAGQAVKTPADALSTRPLETGMFGFQKRRPNDPTVIDNDKEDDDKDDDDDGSKGGSGKGSDQKGGGVKIDDNKDNSIINYLKSIQFEKDQMFTELSMDVKGELKDGAQGIMFNQGVIAQIAKLLIDLGILKEGQVENLDSFTAVISKIIDDLQQDVLDNKANNKTDTLGVKDRPVMNPDQKKGASPGDTKNTNPLDLPYLLPPDWFNPEIFDPDGQINPGDPIFNPDKYPGFDDDTPGGVMDERPKTIPNPDGGDPFNLSEQKGENSPFFFPDLKGPLPDTPEGGEEKDPDLERRYRLLKELFRIPDDFDVTTKSGPGIIIPGLLIAIMGGLTGDMFNQLLTLFNSIGELFNAGDKGVDPVTGAKDFDASKFGMALIGLLLFFLNGSLGLSMTLLLMFFGGSGLEAIIKKALNQDISEALNDLLKEDKDDPLLGQVKGDEDKGDEKKDTKGEGILDLILGQLSPDKPRPELKKVGKDDRPEILNQPGGTMEVPDFVPPSTPSPGGGGFPF